MEQMSFKPPSPGEDVMRVLICGDRNWKDRDAIFACVSALPESVPIIEGKARGADRIAGEAARFYGHTVFEFPADWNQYGKSAGFIRNRQMMKEGKPALVVFFHNNLKASKGTRDMVEIATKAGIPIINGRSVSDWGHAFDIYRQIAGTELESALARRVRNGQ